MGGTKKEAMKIYEVIKKAIEDQIKDECKKLKVEIEAEFTEGEISEIQRVTMIATINQLEKRILERL